ncbi:2-oxoglutarate dehydrogenase E1 subunit family protein, partial [Kineococcus indalonis]|uniref:2-oxoglutarate dehydrogenase E1 subunit family protein n=1 Tax=Kineococcus indalonis TaxID=2696566 RepID=UPI001411ED9F
MPQQPSPHEDKLATFGPNEWLVDELYEQYLKDKHSVDEAWWDFFADYTPADNPAGSTTAAPAAGGAHGGSANGASGGAANGAGGTAAAREAAPA